MRVARALRPIFLSVAANFALIHGQSPLSGSSLPPLQSNFGALSEGILPQARPSAGDGFSGLGAPPLTQGAGFSGLGAPPATQGGGPLGGSGGPLGATGGLLGGIGQAAPGLGAAPAQGGMLGSGQGLPTLNLMGNAMAPGAGGSGTPQNIQQMQAQAVQSAGLDTMCPGKQRSTTNVGAECWLKIWTAGGCKAENVPQYEEWHQIQSLEVLVGDVVQWANLPDDRHKQGCYGDGGPPQNLPAPPMPRAGGMAGGMQSPLGGMGGGSPLGGGSTLGGGSPLGGMGGSPLGGMGGGMQPPPALGGAAQGPAPPPEVSQKIMSALQSPDIGNLCPGVSQSSTAVGEACWKKIWKHVGCLESTTPKYEDWHAAQSFEVLVADAAQWASLPSQKHKETCYGSVDHPEL